MDKIFINCKYRDEIVVPLVCISPNWEYLCTPDGDKIGVRALMKDGIVAKVESSETKAIFQLENTIRGVYKVEPYEWLKRWFDACEGQLSSLYLCHIHLTK